MEAKVEISPRTTNARTQHTRTEAHPPQNNTNYSFMLKCLGALTAAAVITGGIILATTAKASTAALVGAAAVATAAPLAPIAGLLAIIGLIGAVCLLPFLFSGSSSYTVRTPGVYSRPSYYQPTIFPTPVVFGGHNHHHDHGHSYGHGHIDTGHGHGHHHGHVDTGHHGHHTHSHGHF